MPGYGDTDSLMPRPPQENSAMWGRAALEFLRMLPEILQTIEAIMPGRGRGEEKHAAASERIQQLEPRVKDTPELSTARDALISAQVAYANELQRAAAQ
jgi:hypothetical protein